MGKKFKKALTFCYGKSRDCVEIIFQSPASNQLRLQKKSDGRFGSYIQLKKYQKRLRKTALRVFLALIFVFVGIIVGPAIFVPEREAEIYIPSGKGDILISNVSKSQASVVFKTLDSANGNKPLATVADVEVFSDSQLQKFLKKIEAREYAVTHIVPLDGLEEGKTYYLKIKASEDKNMENSKEVNSWGGSDPIKFLAMGDVAPVCPTPIFASETKKDNSVGEMDMTGEKISSSLEESGIFLASSVKSEDDGKMRIFAVENENYLHGREKVQTIISWETNLPGDCVLIYRDEENGKENEVKSSSGMMEKHMVVLTTLKPGTVYYFKVKSQGKSGEIAVSDEYSLRTPRAKDTMLEMVGNNFKSLVRQIGF